MGNKKVLHIIDNLGLGGAQRVIEGIFAGQQENKNVFLFSLRFTKNSTQINHDNITISSSKNKFSFPIFELRKFILENNISVLHCHLAKSQILGGILKKFFFLNITLVFHEHGEIFEEGKIYPFLMNQFLNQLNLYVAVSQATKRKILEKTSFLDEKVIVLYNFVDLGKFYKIPDIQLQNEINEKKFIIGFAGRLIERKGWEVFLHAAQICISKKYNFTFYIAGDGEDREKIENFLKQHNMSDTVKILGYQKDMNEFYNSLDIFVFSSLWEPLGLTGIEANACGCPVIASNIEGLNEIMLDSQNVVLFEKNNTQDLVEKIEMLYQNSEMKKSLIENGFQEVKKYSLEKYLYQLEQLYERI